MRGNLGHAVALGQRKNRPIQTRPRSTFYLTLPLLFPRSVATHCPQMFARVACACKRFFFRRSRNLHKWQTEGNCVLHHFGGFRAYAADQAGAHSRSYVERLRRKSNHAVSCLIWKHVLRSLEVRSRKKTCLRMFTLDH